MTWGDVVSPNVVSDSELFLQAANGETVARTRISLVAGRTAGAQLRQTATLELRSPCQLPSRLAVGAPTPRQPIVEIVRR